MRLKRSRQALLFVHENNISRQGRRDARDATYLDARSARHTRSDRLGNLTDPPFHCTCFIRLRRERKAGEPLWFNPRAITTEGTEVHRERMSPELTMNEWRRRFSWRSSS